MTRFIHIFIIATTLLISAACDNGVAELWDSPEISGGVDGGKIEVSLPVSTSIAMSTRTTIDPDDLQSVRWCVGDRVNLWAEGISNNTSDLAAECFQLEAFSSTFDVARFSAKINPMSQGQYYRYSAFYPYTSSVSGKSVSVTLPSAQSGDYDGKYDLRVADGTLGEALTSDKANDGFDLTFRSVMHVLRVTIPEGYNDLDKKIKKLTITMPANVVGNLSYDTSDPTAVPHIVSGGSNILSVDLSKNPITDGDGRYLWLFIAPTSGVTGDIKIDYVGVGDEIPYGYSIPISNHTFAAGRVTPINTSVGEEMPFTTIRIEIGANNLGEDLTNVNITAPEGAIFKESGTNKMVIKNNGSGYYDMHYITELYGAKFKAGALKVEFESKQALIPMADIALNKITDDASNQFTRDVPYILYENFTSINSYSQDGNPPVGGTDFSSGDKPYIDLHDKGLTTSGWGATRSASNGSTMAICCRGETKAALYEARLNSPALSYLKSGAKIKVSYKYGGSYYAKNLRWNYKDGKVMYQRGYFEGGNPDASDDIANIVYQNNNKDTQVSTYFNENMTYSVGSSSSYTIDSANAKTRLAWRVWGSGIPAFGNANYWLYIDDVVVQVVKK